MKIRLLVFLLSVSSAIFCQKQYLIEYDRINNFERFYELTYSKGTFSENPIKKPILRKGDMIRFRALNVNPLVFNVNVTNPSEQSMVNPGGKAVAGVSNILQLVNNSITYDIGTQLSLLDRGAPEVPQFNITRGVELSPRDQLRMQSLAKLNIFHTSLKTAYNTAKEYEEVAEVAYSTSLTKDEIIGKLKSALSLQNTDAYSLELRKLKISFDEIKNDSLLDESEYKLLEDSYETLIQVVDSSLISPSNKNELISLIESVEFTKEITVILGFNSQWSSSPFNLDAESGYVDYSIEFLDAEAENPDNDQFSDGLLQNHDVHLGIQSTGGFAWATGVNYVGPVGGFLQFSIQEYGDSLRIQSNGVLSSGRLSLGTSLLYNFSSAKSVFPHALIGMSIGFNQDNKHPLNVLLGGGIKFRQFPYIGLSAGIAFCENYKLKNGFQLDKSYALGEYSNESQYFIKRIFSPGYFIGININL